MAFPFRFPFRLSGRSSQKSVPMKASTIALILAFILAVGASFYLGGQFMLHHYESPLGRPDTVYLTKWVRDSTKERSANLVARIPVFLPLFIPDTAFVHDTTSVHDSILVEVPITEKLYAGENYQATVRGFMPELVDIRIKQSEIRVTVPYRKRWGFTVGAQAGFGITPSGWQPYAGVGGTFGYSF